MPGKRGDMFQRLFSSEAEFASSFAAMTHRGVEAAALLRNVLSDPTTRPASLPAIKALIAESGATADELRERAAKTMMTPIDREDVSLLVLRLEGVLSAIERTSWMTEALHIDTADAAAIKLADTLASAAAALEAAVSHLTDATGVAADARVVHRLEEDGDTCYGDAMSALFEGDRTALETLRWKELYGNLEEALDTCAHAVDLVEAVALKRL
jgi:uncharacterized protein Yka (UPF0111/DUF47 family)